jgi:hypothetical protein
MTRRLHRFVLRAARILGQEDASRSGVKGDMDALAARLRVRLEQPGVADRESAVIGQMLKTYSYYRPHLFACYGRPDLTRTTNELEQKFGVLRANERRARAHTSTSRTARDGGYIAGPISELRARGPLPSEDLAAIPAPVRKSNLEKMRCARRRHARARVIRSEFDAAVDRIASYGRRIARNARRGGRRRQMMRC